MKLDPGMHIGLPLVSFGKTGVTMCLLQALLELGFEASHAE
jgi:hypothetical protein